MNAAGSARVNGTLIYILQGPNAKYMLYPYYATLIATSFCTFILCGLVGYRCVGTDKPTATMYMMCRMVLGHKTWY